MRRINYARCSLCRYLDSPNQLAPLHRLRVYYERLPILNLLVLKSVVEVTWSKGRKMRQLLELRQFSTGQGCVVPDSLNAACTSIGFACVKGGTIPLAFFWKTTLFGVSFSSLP